MIQTLMMDPNELGQRAGSSKTLLFLLLVSLTPVPGITHDYCHKHVSDLDRLKSFEVDVTPRLPSFNLVSL